jgi:hypothetical protein
VKDAYGYADTSKVLKKLRGIVRSEPTGNAIAYYLELVEDGNKMPITLIKADSTYNEKKPYTMYLPDGIVVNIRDTASRREREYNQYSKKMQTVTKTIPVMRTEFSLTDVISSLVFDYKLVDVVLNVYSISADMNRVTVGKERVAARAGALGTYDNKRGMNDIEQSVINKAFINKRGIELDNAWHFIQQFVANIKAAQLPNDLETLLGSDRAAAAKILKSISGNSRGLLKHIDTIILAMNDIPNKSRDYTGKKISYDMKSLMKPQS